MSFGVACFVRRAGYLPGGVDAVCIAVGSAQRSEVVHRSARAAGRRWFPQKRASRGVTGGVGLACHLTVGVEAVAKALCSAERSQVSHSAARATGYRWFPQIRVLGRVTSRVRRACHLAACVEGRSRTLSSSQHSQIGDGVESGIRRSRSRQRERRKYDDIINCSISSHVSVSVSGLRYNPKSHRPWRANRAPRRCRAGEGLYFAVSLTGRFSSQNHMYCVGV
jgi:hypothetical protein